jgi:hypothetical protein
MFRNDLDRAVTIEVLTGAFIEIHEGMLALEHPSPMNGVIQLTASHYQHGHKEDQRGRPDKWLEQILSDLNRGGG